MIHVIRWKSAEWQGPVDIFSASVIRYGFSAPAADNYDDGNDDSPTTEISHHRQFAL